MIDLRPDHLAIVERILQGEVPEASVYAFGSRAQWTAKENSDLDLLVDGSHKLPFRVISRLQQAFEDSYLPFSVDIVDRWAIDDEFRELIDQHKVRLKEPSRQESINRASGPWNVLPLAECADFLSGGAPSKARPDFWSGKIPWVTAKDMKQLRLWDSQDHITEEAVENGARVVPPNTILMLVRGMMLRKDLPICITRVPMSFHQDVKALRARPGIDPEFLAYALLGSKRDLLLQVDTAARRIHTGALESFPIPLPPLVEQRAIAHILGTLDDKVELSRRMSETLEAMARALFKSWFVDFDPVRAKVGDLIRQGVLEIGDGYRAKSSELSEPGLPFVRARNLKNGIDTHGADVLHEDSVAKAGNKRSRPGDVAFTSKGTIGRSARVTNRTQPFVYSPQTCFWRSLDHKRLEPAVLYLWMQSDDFRLQVDAVAGQSEMAPCVSLRDQRAMELPVFPKSQHSLAGHLAPLLTRQAQLVPENESLAALRATLLPKLISGELRLEDPKKFLKGDSS